MIYTAKRFAPKPAKIKAPPKAKTNKTKTAATLAAILAATLAQADAEAEQDELVNVFIQAENSEPTYM
jgi:hypothetical protein